MARRKRRNSEAGGGGAPDWMVTYGDLMSLLLTFFVLLVSFSSIELTKFRQAMGSLKGALGVLPKEQSIMWQKEPLLPQLTDFQQKRVQKVISEMRNMIKQNGLENDVTLESSAKGILVRIESPVLFNLGQAELKEQSYAILNKIVEMTQDWPNSIRIEGHTDNLPIHTLEFPSNWELSTARALSVLRFFLDNGHIEPYRLAAVGYGEYHPLVPNDTPENRTKNRRVEIYIDHQDKLKSLRERTF